MLLLFQMRMMLLGSSSYPFSAVESLLYKTLFARPLTFSPLTDSTPSCQSSPIRSKPNGSAPNKPDQTDPKDAENTKKTDWPWRRTDGVIVAEETSCLCRRNFSTRFLLRKFWNAQMLFLSWYLICTYLLEFYSFLSCNGEDNIF